MKRLIVAPRLILSMIMVSVCLTNRVQADEPIVVESAMIRIITQIEVPAREAGVLTQLSVGEGKMVKQGEKIAQIEDSTVQLEAAGKHKELELNRQKTENDVELRTAIKTHEVARAELKRATEAEDKYTGSVLQSEMDFLGLAVEKTGLEIEKAKHELELAKAALALNENELEVANLNVERRRILSPLDGQVVQVDREEGEWVRPGETVLQVLRLDRLRAEGFVPSHLATADLVGRKVTITIDQKSEKPREFSGRVSFVHPTIDPVNREVRIWADINNSDLKLRPGMRGRMTILTEVVK